MTPRELGLSIINDPDHGRARRRVAALCALSRPREPMPVMSAIREALCDLHPEREIFAALLCEGLGGPSCPHGDPWAEPCHDPACPAHGDPAYWACAGPGAGGAGLKISESS